jgi:hypothetical protein
VLEIYCACLILIYSALLSSRYLNEKLNLLGKLGCVICILGSTVVIIHAPKEQDIQTMDELVSKMNESSELLDYSVDLIKKQVWWFYD